MSIPNFPPALLFILFLWSLLWKGLALWNAARNSQKNWFVVILVLNTIGLLEIAYLFFFAKQKLTVKQFQFWKR